MALRISNRWRPRSVGGRKRIVRIGTEAEISMEERDKEGNVPMFDQHRHELSKLLFVVPKR